MFASIEHVETAQSVLDFIGDWWMIRTKGRQEDAMSRVLKIEGVPHFIPQEEVTQIYNIAGGGTKRVTYTRKLWPTYVFACGGSDAWYAMNDCSARASRPEQIKQTRRLLEQLRAYQIAMESGMRLSRPQGLKTGISVEVTQGPLRYLKGKIENLDPEGRKPQRVWLNMELLGSSRSVEIESSDWVEPI